MSHDAKTMPHQHGSADGAVTMADIRRVVRDEIRKAIAEYDLLVTRRTGLILDVIKDTQGHGDILLPMEWPITGDDQAHTESPGLPSGSLPK